MDTLLMNTNCYTMDEDTPQIEAIGIKGSRIAATGSTRNLLMQKNAATTVYDLSGSTVLPGFNDSHTHLLNYGYSLQMINLDGCRSIKEMINSTRTYIENDPPADGQWIEGRGWDETLFDNPCLPNRKDLDQISTRHPIILIRNCSYSVCLNTRAIEVMGWGEDIPHVPGGTVDRLEDNTPSGIFRGNIVRNILEKIPPLAPSKIKKAIRDASLQYLSAGITSVQADDFELVRPGDFRMILDTYHGLAREKRLPVRINQMLCLPSLALLKAYLGIASKDVDDDSFFKEGPFKMTIDGSLGTRTAALRKAYSDDPENYGLLTMDRDILKMLFTTAKNAGLQIVVDGIGDQAIDILLDLFQELYGTTDARAGIDHCQVTDPDILKRFKQQNIIAGLEYVFATSDKAMAPSRIGPDRMKHAYNWKSFHDMNIHVAAGSDSPVESYEPLLNISAAVTRKDPCRSDTHPWMPEQRISVQQAVYAYTMGSAYATREEHLKGSVSKGKLADLVVLSEDIFKINPDRIKEIQVKKCFVGGDLVYELQD